MNDGTKKLIYAICGVAVVACIIYLLFDLNVFGGKDEENNNPPVANETKEPEPTPVAESKLKIFDETSQSRPLGIIINNYPAAMKAQTGLNDAYLIYEFPIEGGMSRSLALFKDKNTAQIGTVRSARQYHPYFAIENDAIFVHWGTNHPAADVIAETKITHLDANSHSGPFFRKNPYKLATEHTGYTSIAKVNDYVKSKKFRDTTTKKPPLKYSYENVDLSSMEGAKVANEIELNYSGSYKLKYTYNSNTGKYERHYNGKDHKDYISGEFFDTKNIIVEYVGIGTVKGYTDTAGTNYLDMTVAGSGKGWYITNGYAREINWSKPTKTDQTVWTYADGTEVNVNDGNTYINFFNKSKTISIK